VETLRRASSLALDSSFCLFPPVPDRSLIEKRRAEARELLRSREAASDPDVEGRPGSSRSPVDRARDDRIFFTVCLAGAAVSVLALLGAVLLLA
jgi:hypothetical protein